MAEPEIFDTTPECAIALQIEYAVSCFEALQYSIEKNLKNSTNRSEESNDDSQKFFLELRHNSTIIMALAKEFIFSVSRTRRLCLQYKKDLHFDGDFIQKFMEYTNIARTIRDRNEHSYDKDVYPQSERQIHFKEGGFIDETSLMIEGPEKIYMGPINLFEMSHIIFEARDLWGFHSLRDKKNGIE